LKNERLRAVFEAAAKQFGWGKSKSPGQGFGMGGGYEKLGNIATFAEVNVDSKSGDVRVVREYRHSSAVRSSIPTTCAIRSKDRMCRGWAERCSRLSNSITARY